MVSRKYSCNFEVIDEPDHKFVKRALRQDDQRRLKNVVKGVTRLRYNLSCVLTLCVEDLDLKCGSLRRSSMLQPFMNCAFPN
jgi:hypothetical protein